jgi:hypothetical protein
MTPTTCSSSGEVVWTAGPTVLAAVAVKGGDVVAERGGVLGEEDDERGGERDRQPGGQELSQARGPGAVGGGLRPGGAGGGGDDRQPGGEQQQVRWAQEGFEVGFDATQGMPERVG